MKEHMHAFKLISNCLLLQKDDWWQGRCKSKVGWFPGKNTFSFYTEASVPKLLFLVSCFMKHIHTLLPIRARLSSTRGVLFKKPVTWSEIEGRPGNVSKTS